MRTPRESRRRGRSSTRVGVIVTVALHGGLIVAVGIAHSTPISTPHRTYTVLPAEMINLGKRPNDTQLPRITQPSRAAQPPKPPNISDKSSATHVQDPRRVVVPESPGDPGGSEFGASDHNVGDRYLAEIAGRLRQNYFLAAGLTPEQLATPPEIRFSFTDDGTIFDVAITKPSGNPLLDDACLSAARLTRQLPAPPADFALRTLRISCEK